MISAAPGNGWLRSGQVECLLPSGYEVRVVLPSLRHLVRHGVLPTHLHEAALLGSDPEWLADAESHDERQMRVGEYMAFLVAWSVRETLEPGADPETGWEPAQLTADLIATGRVAQDDLDLLEDLVLRTRSASDLTARSLQIRAQAESLVAADVPDLNDEQRKAAAEALRRLAAATGRPMEELADLVLDRLRDDSPVDTVADEILAAIGEESIPGWHGFRGEPGSAAPGADGEPVGDTPEQPDRPDG